jgi:hypothetical protein
MSNSSVSTTFLPPALNLNRNLPANFDPDKVDIGELMEDTPTVDYKEGTYTLKAKEGYEVRMTQSKPGENVMVNVVTESGMEFQLEYEVTEDGVMPKAQSMQVKSNGLLSAAEEKKLESSWTDQMYQDIANGAYKKNGKKNLGGAIGDMAALNDAGESLSAAGESISAAGEAMQGMDGGSSDSSGNWFIEMAEALGSALNKMARELKAEIDAVELTNGQPPFKDAMRIQGLAQQLSFVSQAFMTALNSVGEGLKTTLTAGGAAR